MVMLCDQHGVEIQAGLNIASEGQNCHWEKGLNSREIAKLLAETKFRAPFLGGGTQGNTFSPLLLKGWRRSWILHQGF